MRGYRWRRARLSLACLFALGAFAGAARAQDSASDVRKLARSPFADVFTIPVEEDLFQSTGPFDREASSFTIRPLLPFPLGDNWLLVVRPTTTVYSFSPDVDHLFGGDTGFGDFSPSLFFGHTRVRHIVYGAGLVFQLPTATHGVGTGKWSMGPTGAVVFQPDWGAASIVAQQLWSVGGDPDRSAVRQFELDLAVSRNLPRGWYVGSAPSITADWTQRAGQRWVVPLGAMAGMSTTLGHQAIDWNAGVYRMAVRPTDTSVWQIALQFTVLFTKNRIPQARAGRSGSLG